MLIKVVDDVIMIDVNIIGVDILCWLRRIHIGLIERRSAQQLVQEQQRMQNHQFESC